MGAVDAMIALALGAAMIYYAKDWYRTESKTSRAEYKYMGKPKDLGSSSLVNDLIDFDDPNVGLVFGDPNAGVVGKCVACGEPLPFVYGKDDPNRYAKLIDVISYMKVTDDDGGGKGDKAGDGVCKRCYRNNATRYDDSGYVGIVRMGKISKE
jgi:hypothetical protein